MACVEADLVDSLKDAGPTVTGGPRRRRVTLGLILAQFVLAAILATGSGLLLRSADALHRQGPGFEHTSRIVIGLFGTDTGYRRIMEAAGRTQAEAEQAVSSSGEAYWAAREQFRRSLLERVAALPGVLGVTSATSPVMSSEYWLARFQTESAAQEGAGEGIEGVFTSVDPNYFAEMRIRLLEGRTFGPDDRRGLPPVAVVGAETARRMWPGRSALGKQYQSVATGKAVVHRDRCRRRRASQQHGQAVGAASLRAVGAEPLVVWPESRRAAHSRDPSAIVAPLRSAMAEIDKDAYILGLHRVGDLVARIPRGG